MKVRFQKFGGLKTCIPPRYIDVARQCVAIMASIRPDIFLPGLVTKLETSLWCLTSPHKFTAAAKCLGSVAR